MTPFPPVNNEMVFTHTDSDYVKTGQHYKSRPEGEAALTEILL